MKLVGLSTAALILVAAVSEACADVVFSNLPAAPSFSFLHSVGISQLEPSAVPFTVAEGAGFDLTRIDIGIIYDPFFPSYADGAVVQLLSRNSYGSRVFSRWH